VKVLEFLRMVNSLPQFGLLTKEWGNGSVDLIKVLSHSNPNEGSNSVKGELQRLRGKREFLGQGFGRGKVVGNFILSL
jgi:hypothetical protein